MSSVCDNATKSASWDFSNWRDNQTRYGNFFGSNSVNVNVQETSHTDSLDVFAAVGFSDRMEVIIHGMNLDKTQRAIPSSNCNRKVSSKRAWGAFLPLAIDIIKCSAQSSNPSADGFQSDSDEQRKCSRDDAEYYPTTPIGITYQQTPNPLPSSGTRASTSTSTPTSRACKRSRTDSHTHASASSRNRQATSDQVEDIRAKLSLCRINRARLEDLDCPIMDCQYKQLNGRVPDFRRHVKTHIRKEGEIRCKGVPWEHFMKHSHLYPKISMDQQPYAVPGEGGLWIGGCQKTFSRADALKRHLRNTCCAGLNQNRY